jgi:hypothetical protein
MTSFKQIEANRRNSLKSTGPKTETGKQTARCNAVRHGLTAETVIGALEDIEDYKAFEAAITADYDAQSAVERELVLRFPTLSSHVVSCGSAICPIVPSTASVAMKLFFGAKPGRFFMRSTIWIAANHRRECGVFVVAANKYSQASGAKSIEGGQRPNPSLVRNRSSDKIPFVRYDDWKDVEQPVPGVARHEPSTSAPNWGPAPLRMDPLSAGGTLFGLKLVRWGERSRATHSPANDNAVKQSCAAPRHQTKLADDFDQTNRGQSRNDR